MCWHSSRFAITAAESMWAWLARIQRGDPAPFELRAFFTDPQGGAREDPVTGSLNASITQWLLATGRATAPYTAAHGTRLGRFGRIYIHQDHRGIWVGGRTTTMFSGVCET